MGVLRDIYGKRNNQCHTKRSGCLFPKINPRLIKAHEEKFQPQKGNCPCCPAPVRNGQEGYQTREFISRQILWQSYWVNRELRPWLTSKTTNRCIFLCLSMQVLWSPNITSSSLFYLWTFILTILFYLRAVD